jgi:hypothetical protein
LLKAPTTSGCTIGWLQSHGLTSALSALDALEERNEVSTPNGRIAIGWLIVEEPGHGHDAGSADGVCRSAGGPQHLPRSRSRQTGSIQTDQERREALSCLNYRLAIFDSDGALADTLPWMRSIFNELAEAHGFRRVESHEYERFRDLHGHALLRELAD